MVYHSRILGIDLRTRRTPPLKRAGALVCQYF